MTEVEFEALEYRADDSFGPMRYAFSGDVEAGWDVRRADQPHLRLGPGYRQRRTQRRPIIT